MIVFSKEDQERFNHIAYAYRMARPEYQQEVTDRYNELVELVIQLIEDATKQQVALEE